jgi:hypothetical protein
MSLLSLTLLAAAHEGEEFAIMLPAIMLVGAFFVLRWANQNDKDSSEDAVADEEDVLAGERPVGLVLPKIKTDDEISLSYAAPSRPRPDGDETTR